MPTHCPACKKPIDPEAIACPHCPMSFDTHQGQFSLHHETVGQRQLLLLLFLFAAFCVSLWKLFAFLLGSGGTLPFDFMGSGHKEPAPYISVKMEPSGKTAVASSSPSDLIRAAGQKTRSPKPSWNFKGTVYDLVTLKPITGCAVVFSDIEANHRFRAATGKKGRYRIAVPEIAGRSYTVALSKKGYSSSYLMPKGGSPRELSVKKRRKMSAELSRTVIGGSSLKSYGPETTPADFYLAPR